MGDPATIPYRPGGGCEGLDFEAMFCDRCARLTTFRAKAEPAIADCCEIKERAWLYTLGDSEYPTEWVSDPDGSHRRCLAFEVDPKARGSRPTGADRPTGAPLAICPTCKGLGYVTLPLRPFAQGPQRGPDVTTHCWGCLGAGKMEVRPHG